MNRRVQILPLIILGLLAILEGYAYAGIQVVTEAYSPALSAVVWSVFYGLMGATIFSFLVILGFRSKLPKSLGNFLLAAVFINLFTLLIVDVFLLLDDLRRLIYLIAQSNDSGRSITFLSIGFIVAVLPALLFLLGMIIGPYRYRVLETVIPLKNLPPAFDGLKIVQFSDVHSGSFYNKKAVNRGIDLMLEQNADVIFFTGDLVNDDASEMSPYKEIFSRVKAPMGVYSILGNHDYGDYVQWPSAEAKADNLRKLKAVHSELGWRLLLNEHVYLEKENQKLGLIGVENWGKGFHQVGDLARAYEGCMADVKLLLSHDPTHWDEQVTRDYTDIDVTFSGHTHGAQMGFEIGKYRWSPIQLRYKKWAGLYQLKKQFLYINRGFGFLGYPGRLGIWPEISVIKLVNK